MKNNLNGGYIMVDLSDVKKAYAALANSTATKPVIVYDQDSFPFYADKVHVGKDYATIVKSGSTIIIKKTGTLYNITDMTKIPSDVLDALECGDKVLKKTTNQFHAYTVSYKEHEQGICLTYVDASLVETVSYDYTDGAWVYNSTDITPLTD